MANYFDRFELKPLDSSGMNYRATIVFKDIPSNKKIVRMDDEDSDTWEFNGCQTVRLEYKLEGCPQLNCEQAPTRVENIVLDFNARTCTPDGFQHQTGFFIPDNREQRIMNTDDGKKR